MKLQWQVKRSKDFSDCGADGINGSRVGFSKQVLELSEHLLDRIEIGGVFGEQEELSAGGADQLTHDLALVTAEIIHDDDVAWAQRRHEDALDIGPKALPVDWSVNEPGRIDPVEAQCGHERRRRPAPMWGLGDETLTARRPSTQRRHVGLGPGLVDEDQAFRLDAILILCPLRPSARHVGAIAFASHHAFF